MSQYHFRKIFGNRIQIIEFGKVSRTDGLKVDRIGTQIQDLYRHYQ